MELAVVLGAVTVQAAAPAAAPTSGPPVPTLSEKMPDTFTLHACPAGPAGDVCVTNTVSGSVPQVGAVTGLFESHYHVTQATSIGCLATDKHGTFRTADGSTLQLSGTGFFCGDTFIAVFDFRLLGGTGFQYFFGTFELREHRPS